MALVVEGFRNDAAVIVRAAGQVDGETAPELARVCNLWIVPGDKNLIMDLTEVTYMSSAGLSSILSAGKQMSRQGGRLLICGVAGRLKQIFTISGFGSLFSFCDTQREALAQCEGSTS